MEATVSFFLLFAGYMLFYSIRNERHLFQDGFLIVISVLMLTFHIFSPLGISFMISSRLCIVFFNHKLAVPKRRIMGMILFCMLICLSSLSRGDVSSVTDLRNATMEKIHDLRYGENVLPRGDLYKASMLQSSDEEMIEIQTAQEKNLYLRGFVGSQYRNGKWKELNAESYAGKNAGMLSWLKENSFDPLYQVSRYYNLPESFSIQRKVSGMRIVRICVKMRIRGFVRMLCFRQGIIWKRKCPLPSRTN